MKSNHMILSILALSSLFLASGCAKVNAEDLNQNAWRGYYDVHNLGNQVRCVASYRAGGSTGSFIELKSAEDAVYCNDKIMKKIDSSIGEVYYEAYADVPTNNNVRIELKRKAGSYFSEVQLASRIEMTTPTLGGNVNKGSMLYRQWIAKPNSRMRIMLQYSNAGKTTYVDRFQSNDEGQVRFDENEVPHSSILGVVPAKIHYTRINIGSMPDGLQGTIQSTSSMQESLTFQ